MSDHMPPGCDDSLAMLTCVEQLLMCKAHLHAHCGNRISGKGWSAVRTQQLRGANALQGCVKAQHRLVPISAAHGGS